MKNGKQEAAGDGTVLYIDPEFSKLIKYHTESDKQRLESAGRMTGTAVIRIWDDKIICDEDLFRLCSSHGIPFTVTRLGFKDVSSAKAYICREELSERTDLTGEWVKYLKGKLLQLEIEIKTGPKQKFRLERATVVDILSHEFGVSVSVLNKYFRYSHAIDRFYSINEDFARLVLEGGFRFSYDTTLLMAKLPEEQLLKPFEILKHQVPHHLTFDGIQKMIQDYPCD